MQWFIPRDANQPKAPSISAVPGTAFVAFAVHNALKKHQHRHRTEHRLFHGNTDRHRPTLKKVTP